MNRNKKSDIEKLLKDAGLKEIRRKSIEAPCEPTAEQGQGGLYNFPVLHVNPEKGDQYGVVIVNYSEEKGEAEIIVYGT